MAKNCVDTKNLTSPTKDASGKFDDRPKQSSDFKTWSITSGERSGIDGRDKAFSISSAGTIAFEDRRAKVSAEMKTDNPETFAQIGYLLRRLDLPNAERKTEDKKSDCPGCGDQLSTSL